MRSGTLLGRLLTVQAVVVLLTSTTLTIGAGVAGAAVIRRHQDGTLQALAEQLVAAIRKAGVDGSLDIPLAADDVFAGTAVEGHHFELADSGGVRLSTGGAIGWESPPKGVSSGCRSASGTYGTGEVKYRTCAVPIDDTFAVRVSAPDLRALPETHLAVGALLFAVPLAVVAGAAFGYAAIRRELRPLDQLRRAASALRPGGSLKLGIRPTAAELADLEAAFEAILARLGEALTREHRFVQDASHELRTPLTVLRARVAWLVDSGVPEDPNRAELLAIGDNLRALERLVDALLLLARADTPSPLREIVNLADVAREAVASRNEGAAAPDLVLPDEVLVRGDADLLGRVVANLLENVARHAGQGAAVRLAVSEDGDWATLTCEDSGVGAGETESDRLFDRFYRGTAPRAGRPGAGLGLSVVRSVARLHGGDADAGPSTLGGLRVTVRIPTA